MSIHAAWAAAAVSLAALGQPLPDQLDILRGGDTTPQIQLLLDSSGSMGWDPALTVCSYYPTAQSTLIGSYQSQDSWFLSRTDQLKAALTGCRSPTDGVLDLWSDRVLFAIREFGGSRTGILEDFDPSLSNHAALESAVMGLRASGGTPLAPAFRSGAHHFDQFFSDSNTKRCRQNYLVVMSDGVGNSHGPVAFDFVAGQDDLSVHDANYCFGQTGSSCPPPPYLDEAAGYLLSDSSGQTVDVLSKVSGTQPIRTYTIGFQAPTAADELLRAMAARGDGKAYSATTYEQLSAAFEEIIFNIVARSRIAFTAGSVESDGLFSGNRLYVSAFRPMEDGHWIGTTKKMCVLPDATSTGCLFLQDPADPEAYLVNPSPRDMWTGSTSPDADVGGSGEVMLTSTFGVSHVTDPPPTNPLQRRTILTWRPGEHGYVRVDPSELNPRDTWSSDPCTHHALLNSIHGFSEQVASCSSGDLSPATFDNWPLGDTVHSGTVLLQYSKACEGSSDHCFAVTAANDGMLHFFDAVTGEETAAIIPGELWRPNTIAHHKLADRDRQPALDTTRRYYFDGRLTVYHADQDADGVIDSNEEAYLIAGLGRGGRGYYLFDVRRFSGVPNATDNPPRPLLADESSGFRNLRDTWAAPWTGELEIGTDDRRSVAVFPSGHVAELDAPSAGFADFPVASPIASPDSEAQPFTVSCADLGIPSQVCRTPDPASFCPALGLNCSAGPCSPCPMADPAGCLSAGLNPPYCYDWPGISVLPPEMGVWTRPPLDLASGPFRYQTSDRRGLAYRVHFSYFDMQPGDYVAFFDDEQREIARLTGTQTSTSVATPWIYAESFTMRVVTNGADDAVARGYAIAGIDIIRSPQPASPGEIHRPSLFIVDLARWNANAELSPPYSAANPGLFSAAPTGADARQAEAIRVRMTSRCTGSTGTRETCIDMDTAPETSDLQWMVCPISAEPSVFTEGGILRAIYFGDECGQLWSAKVDINGAWSVRRLLRLNTANGGGFTVAGQASKDYRKIFRSVDLVVSTCPGRRATGVYFGTGNLQRPAAENALQDPAVSGLSNSVVSGEREVVGVVWDTPSLPVGASLDDLVNVTQIAKIADPTAPGHQHGWFIELANQERMLRDPFVFDAVAYFDVYRPTSAPSECISATGESRTLVMDNCTAEPLAVSNPTGQPDADRTAAVRTDSTIGGGFLLLTPLGQAPIVTLGQEATGSAALPGRPNRGAMRLLMWRP